MTDFNPDDFMSESTSNANPTRIPPCPEGEFAAVVGQIEGKSWAKIEGKDGRDDQFLCRIPLEIQDDEVKQALGRENVIVSLNCWFPIDPVSNKPLIDESVDLGRLREALGMNEPGQPFSMGQLSGSGPIIVTVSHREGKDGEIYDQVRRVQSLS